MEMFGVMTGDLKGCYLAVNAAVILDVFFSSAADNDGVFFRRGWRGLCVLYTRMVGTIKRDAGNYVTIVRSLALG